MSDVKRGDWVRILTDDETKGRIGEVFHIHEGEGHRYQVDLFRREYALPYVGMYCRGEIEKLNAMEVIAEAAR